MNGNKVSFKRRQWLLTSLSIVLIVSMLAMVLDLKPSNGGLMQSYIVQGQDVNRVVQLVERYGGTVTSRLDIIHGVGAMLSAPAAASLRSEAAITAITDNATVRATGNGNAPATDYADLVGADVVWDQGVTGSGVTVAVLDTGFSNHNGIKDNVIAWVDFVEGKNNQKDPSGHGTHIGGVIANTQIGEDGEANGIAPGAKLAGVRVLNEQGFGSYEKVIQGIQWVINNKNTYGIRVMNLSLVSPVQSPYWADPLNQAVMQAWAAGIVVVVAAGNGGPGPMTVGVPGDNPYVITVGAFSDNYTPYDWDDDFITPFSAAGPTLDGFVKPDVVAPGAHVVSTMIFSANLAKEYPERKIPPQYFTMAGTSQSAAVVSGVAALVLSANPDLTPDQVKHRISCTAFPWVDPTTTMALYSAWQQGSGRVNAPGAAFEEVDGTANVGMDISADLAGSQHYEGYSYYDETTGLFRMHGDFMDWGGGYWTWDGGYGSWSGGYGSWSGGYGSWSGGYGSWSGGYGSWSGGYGSWSGGYGSWSGGYGSWSGSEPWAGMVIAQPAFVEPFLAGVIPNTSTSITSIGFIDAP